MTPISHSPIYYSIANHLFRIEGEGTSHLYENLPNALPFAIQHIEQQAPLFSIQISVPLPDWQKTDLSAWNIETLYSFEGDTTDCVFAKYPKGYLFRMESRIGDPTILMIKEHHSAVFYTNFFPCQHPNCSNFIFLLWIAYGIACVSKKTLALHASTIYYKNKAVLFLGESGTGKSTHTALWQKHIPGVSLLNDDSPIIRIIDKQAWAFGSMWSGKIPCHKNECYPIAALVRLNQAPCNNIQRLKILPALSAVLPSCPTLFAYDEVLSDYICQTVSDIIEKTPVFNLNCLPDKESALLSFNSIFK
ncbi:MAG: hypothetical protein WCY35_01560 [Bacteroidales bacterium]